MCVHWHMGTFVCTCVHVEASTGIVCICQHTQLDLFIFLIWIIEQIHVLKYFTN